MASGHARAEFLRTRRRVKILDARGRARWDPIWEGLPYIARPLERGCFATIRNGAQCRPYVQYPFNHAIGQKWTSWRARDHMGEIALSDSEKRAAEKLVAGGGAFVVIEPTIGEKKNQNKQWGRDNWLALADMLLAAGFNVLQLGPAAAPIRPGVRYVVTPTFREATAVLNLARAAVLPEGGLHHAAAVLGVPAVVLFGGYIDPEVTGYPSHVNIVDDGVGSPCGSWVECRHCAAVWARTKPADVFASFIDLIEIPREGAAPEQKTSARIARHGRLTRNSSPGSASVTDRAH